MNKLFIADDEEMERESLCEFCNWEALDIEIIGEARNGKLALEKIKNERPDIIITDIKMPVMDGLEFARRAKELYPDVKIIFISGYDDFKAAREAISLDASAYLLKPVNISELFNTVCNVINQSIQEKFKNKENEYLNSRLVESIPYVRDNFIRDIVLGIKEYDQKSLVKRAKYLKIPVLNSWYCLLLITLHHMSKQDYNTEETSQKQIIIAREEVESVIADFPNSYVVQVHDDEICVLLRLSSILDENNANNILETICVTLMKKIKIKFDLPITIGVSNLSQNLLMLRQLYKQCKIATAQRIFQESSSIIKYEIERDVLQEAQLPDIEMLQSKIQETLWLADKEKMNEIIDDYFARLAEVSNIDIYHIKSVCLQIFGKTILSLHEMNRGCEDDWIKKIFNWDGLRNLETLSETRDYIKKVIIEITDSLFAEKMDEKIKLVHSIKRYVSENYSDNISIEQIASELYLSSGYLSRIFKNNTGITILEYITAYRMKQACKLLINTNKKIVNIALSVGYDSNSYFGSQFRAIYNMTPSEFRKKMKNKNNESH